MSRVHLLNRREFLGGVFSAGAFVLATTMVSEEAFAAAARVEGGPLWQPSGYVGLEPDGTVVIVTHRSEMGTGIRTGLPMVLADEMDADWKRVRIDQAIGDPKYGTQNTDGSSSIVDFYDSFRQAGATARVMLERAAASKWGVPATE